MYATLDKYSNGEVLNLKTIYDVMFNLGFLLIILGGIGKRIIYERLCVPIHLGGRMAECRGVLS